MNFLYLWVVKRTVYILLAAFVVLASIPWLVPHLGAFALFAFVPLLCADRIAEDAGIRHFLALVYLAFVLWNAATTWWVCEATVGGGIFAVLANAAQMWLVWAAFRLNKKRLKGCLSYILLASAWVAWEKWYLVSAQISWPWLALGNAFASTTSLVQWYSATGLLGGSLWIWACNLSLFGLMVALSDGRFFSLNSKARVCSLAGTALVLLAPIIISEHIYRTYEQKDECGTLDVAIAQSDFDPYEKFVKYTQNEQNDCALRLFSNIGDGPLLLMTPETFTSDVVLNNIAASPTVSSFMPLLESHPRANLLLGSATVGYSYKKSAPSKVARSVGNAWVQSHNSALMLDHSGRADVYHKSKLVVGTEIGSENHIGCFDYSEGAMSKPMASRAFGWRYKDCAFFGADVPEGVRTIALNPKTRIPLWELVYHDCSVSYYHWMDTNMIYPEHCLWRDLFCVLYGLPPIYSMRVEFWDRLKDQVAKSYRRVSPVARLTTFARMTDFEYLSADRLVQRTRFDNGLTVVVNFSDEPRPLPDGGRIGPESYLTFGWPSAD